MRVALVEEGVGLTVGVFGGTVIMVRHQQPSGMEPRPLKASSESPGIIQRLVCFGLIFLKESSSLGTCIVGFHGWCFPSWSTLNHIA